MDGVDDLVTAETHFFQEHRDGFVGLGGGWLLSLPPAQDPVLHGLRAAADGLRKVDHLLNLGVVIDVQQVQRASVLYLLPIATGPWAGDVVDQGADVEGLALLRGSLRRGDFLDDHAVAPAVTASLSIAAWRAPSAAAVCWA